LGEKKERGLCCGVWVWFVAEGKGLSQQMPNTNWLRAAPLRRRKSRAEKRRAENSAALSDQPSHGLF
jgi:hypothetical protein